MVDDKNEDNNDNNAETNKGMSTIIITDHKNAKFFLGNVEDDSQRDLQKVDSISMATAGLKPLCIAYL